MVGRQIAPERYRVSKSSVIILHVHPKPGCAQQTLFIPFNHVIPEFEIFLDGILSCGRVNPVDSFVPHLFHGCVIYVNLAFLDEPRADI